MTTESQDTTVELEQAIANENTILEEAKGDDPVDELPVVKVMGGELTKRDGDAGYDLRADITKVLSLRPGQRVCIPTSITLELPDGYAGFVLPRSGLARDYGVTVANAPGLIDSSYRGRVIVALAHTGSERYGDRPFAIEPNARIAQLVIVKISDLAVIPVDEVSETERGAGGFGSTGLD